MKSVGSRAEVFHGNAKKTSGGLEKKHLKKNKQGNIVSKKAQKAAIDRYNHKDFGIKIQKGLLKGCRKLAKLGKLKRSRCTQMLGGKKK